MDGLFICPECKGLKREDQFVCDMCWDWREARRIIGWLVAVYGEKALEKLDKEIMGWKKKQLGEKQ